MGRIRRVSDILPARELFAHSISDSLTSLLNSFESKRSESLWRPNLQNILWRSQIEILHKCTCCDSSSSRWYWSASQVRTASHKWLLVNWKERLQHFELPWRCGRFVLHSVWDFRLCSQCSVEQSVHSESIIDPKSVCIEGSWTKVMQISYKYADVHSFVAWFLWFVKALSKTCLESSGEKNLEGARHR